MAKEAKSKKKHLHRIVSEQAHDGTIVHHHTYKGSKDDDHTEPERMNAATSQNPEDAGEHVAEQFAMNGMGGDPQAEAGAPAPAEGAAPDQAAAQPEAV